MEKIARVFVMAGMTLGASAFAAETNGAQVIINTSAQPAVAGKFEPTWDSLKQYQCPQWFRDAKFGIWAHWGPQCQPKDGDWYARGMCQTGSWQYRFHTDHHGSPAQFGFKDVPRVARRKLESG